MAFVRLLGNAVGVVKRVIRVVCAPTLFLLRLLLKHGRRQISQVAYNLAGPEEDFFLSSALRCAASRAAEALKEDALFVDPLAKHFAQGVSPGHDRQRPSNEERHSTSENNRRSVSYTITRTKYIDDALLVVLGDQERGTNAMFDDVREVVGSSEATCQQVVMLGAGFDSRPWRLPLGAARWFEVDLRDVILEKKRLLDQIGASTDFSRNVGSRFPLLCLSIAMIPTNVRRWSWIRHLEASGLKSSVPTIWVMEGLLVYMEPHHVKRILNQLCAASPSGSFMMASFISESQMKGTRRGPVKDKWKWGCPENVDEYFLQHGWSVVTVIPWTVAAKMYGCKPRKRSFAKEQAQFLIAVKP